MRYGRQAKSELPAAVKKSGDVKKSFSYIHFEIKRSLIEIPLSFSFPPVSLTTPVVGTQGVNPLDNYYKTSHVRVI